MSAQVGVSLLDPREPGGYAPVGAYSVGILVLSLAIGTFVRWWGDERGHALAAVDS